MGSASPRSQHPRRGENLLRGASAPVTLLPGTSGAHQVRSTSDVGVPGKPMCPSKRLGVPDPRFDGLGGAKGLFEFQSRDPLCVVGRPLTSNVKFKLP